MKANIHNQISKSCLISVQDHEQLVLEVTLRHCIVSKGNTDQIQFYPGLYRETVTVFYLRVQRSLLLRICTRRIEYRGGTENNPFQLFQTEELYSYWMEYVSSFSKSTVSVDRMYSSNFPSSVYPLAWLCFVPIAACFSLP